MNQELKLLLETLKTIVQEKYLESKIDKDSEDEKSIIFRAGCGFAYSNVLDIIDSQIKAYEIKWHKY